MCLMANFTIFASAQNDAQARAKKELSQGVSAYKAANYERAIEHFGNAVGLNPDFTMAHLYLATSYSSQYVPGLDEPDNVKMASNAIAEYLEVLKREPNSPTALKSIGWVYLQLKKYEDARQYYRRAIGVDGNDPELYYSAGVMDWSEVYQNIAEERAKMNFKSSQTLIFDNACAAIRAKNMRLVEDGVTALAKAISLREDFDDAMVYMNLLYRSRADMECGDEPASREDARKADEWSNLAMAARKKKAEGSQQKPGPASGPVLHP
jgi:tetratricopeptide (TPR) repeat protein